MQAKIRGGLLCLILFSYLFVQGKSRAARIESDYRKATLRIREAKFEASKEKRGEELKPREMGKGSSRSITFKIWEGEEFSRLGEDATVWEYWEVSSLLKRKEVGLIGSLDIESDNQESLGLMKVQNVTYKLIQSMDILSEESTEASITNLASYYRINTKIQDFFLRNYNLELTPYDSQPLYEFIMRWHRTPYVWGGSSKHGVDCSGFVGILVDSLYQRKIPRVAGNIYQICQKIEKENLREGDMVFFIRGNYIFHVGLYLKNNKFVHSSSGLGVIISDLDEPYWRRYYFGGGRLKD